MPLTRQMQNNRSAGKSEVISANVESLLDQSIGRLADLAGDLDYVAEMIEKTPKGEKGGIRETVLDYLGIAAGSIDAAELITSNALKLLSAVKKVAPISSLPSNTAVAQREGWAPPRSRIYSKKETTR